MDIPSCTNTKPILLLVDDDEDILHALKGTLRNIDATIVDFSSPVAALEYCQINQPQVVISDQRMPEMDGCEFLEKIKKASKAPSHVLLLGESGTGKSLIASDIHYHSKRASGPFITINCAMIPEALLESELFGHKKGAFTGAEQDKAGWIKNAEGGTLFID